MEKRYQVFVSSTYTDLKPERQRVIQTLIEMDCIPAGMELFPAADEEQWEFIKKVINDCDYYLLIIGGRYGSLTPEGISYTEKEYDYAVNIGLKVMALIHEDPEQIPVGRSDIDPDLRDRLQAFRDKVSIGRLVKFWTKPDALPGMVALSLTKTMKTSPAVGWVRANAVANQDLLSQLNDLRQENVSLSKKVKELQELQPVPLKGLAGLDEQFTIHGKYRDGHFGERNWSVTLTWGQVFAYIAPYLLEFPNEALVRSHLLSTVKQLDRSIGSLPELNDQEFKTIAVQLKALGLVQIRYSQTVQGGMALFWSLTPQGERTMRELRTVRSSKQRQEGN